MQRCAVLLVALVLALPGTALAQGAGDNQYQDPFSGQGSGQSGSGSQGSGSQGSGSQGSGSSSSGSSSSGSSSPGSSSSGSSSSSSGNSQSPPATSSASGNRTLPATGGQPITLALLGAGLLLAGMGLRLRLRRPVG